MTFAELDKDDVDGIVLKVVCRGDVDRVDWSGVYCSEVGVVVSTLVCCDGVVETFMVSVLGNVVMPIVCVSGTPG